MNLYQKHRPQTFDEIRGNDDTITSLKEIIHNSHVFLLHGETGCGKTTIARIIANEVGTDEKDLQEINTADFTGIEKIREIRQKQKFKPLNGKTRTWIIDEVHRMSIAAQEAMLKLLEETPNHIYFILCTTNPEKLTSTLKGRCNSYKLESLSERDIVNLLSDVLKNENKEVDRKVLRTIAKTTQYPRNALQELEHVLSVSPEKQLEVIGQEEKVKNESIELCRSLIKNEKWSTIKEILKGLQKEDSENIRRHVLGYCKSVLLNKENPTAGLIMGEFLEPFYNSGFPGLVFACYSVNIQSQK